MRDDGSLPPLTSEQGQLRPGSQETLAKGPITKFGTDAKSVTRWQEILLPPRLDRPTHSKDRLILSQAHDKNNIHISLYLKKLILPNSVSNSYRI